MAEQKSTPLDWEDVRVFVALARHGSLSAAARALAINHATVARRVLSLEEAVGEKLVERRPDGYLLTPAGSRLLGPASEMEAAAAAFARGGGDDRPHGLVRINAPPTLAQGFLVERLARLAVQEPGLDIDVATDVRSVSLERRETDIALRYGRPQDGDVIARMLSVIGFALYATAEYGERLAAGDPLAFVGFDEQNAHLPEAVWLARHYPQARMSFRTSSQLAQAAAARAHAGVALLPCFLGKADPALRPVPLEHQPPDRELWLITRRQDKKDVAIQTVSAFLIRMFAGEEGLRGRPLTASTAAPARPGATGGGR